MATRHSEKDYVQFSKKLITFVILFWSIIRLVSVVATIINPDSGVSMASIVKGVDDIAMINVFAYTGNSISEKISLGYFKYKSEEIKSGTKIAQLLKKENSEEESESETGNG